MYTEEPAKWAQARNGIVPGRRPQSAWDVRLSSPDAPDFRALSYFRAQESWGDRIPPAPVIGDPSSVVTGDRLHVALANEGLGALTWKGAGKAIKKAVRYTGATVAAPFVPAATLRKGFGLTGRESKGFEVYAKVSRGVGAAVITAGAAYTIAGMGSAASAPAGAIPQGGLLSLPGGSTAAAPGYFSGQAAASSAILPTATGTSLAAKAVSALGTIGKIGVGAGKAVLMAQGAANLLGRGAAGAGTYISDTTREYSREFVQGYESVMGDTFPSAQISRIGEQVSDFVKAQVSARAQEPTAYGGIPTPTGEGGGGASPYSFETASFGDLPLWLIPAVGGLLAWGVFFSKRKLGRRRR